MELNQKAAKILNEHKQELKSSTNFAIKNDFFVL